MNSEHVCQWVRDVKMLLFVLAAMGGLSGGRSSAFAQDWTPTSAPSGNWAAVASSADGIRFVAAIYGGPIYTSADSGATWAPTIAGNRNWTTIASSANGSKLVGAVAFGGSVYTSTNAGATWAETSLRNQYWAGVASSANGSRLIAAAHNAPI